MAEEVRIAHYPLIKSVIAEGKKKQVFSARISVDRDEEYGKISEIKFPLEINNYTDGTGDRAVRTRFNMDLKDAKWLFRCVWNDAMKDPLYRIKIHSFNSACIKEGPFKGLYPTQTLNVSRMENERDGSGLWRVDIANGYAKRMPGKHAGAFYPKDFQKEKGNSFYLSSTDFFDVLSAMMEYAFFADMQIGMKEGKIEKDLQMSADARSRGSYQNDLTASPSRSVQRREEVQRSSVQRAEQQEAAPSAVNIQPAAEKTAEVPSAEPATEPVKAAPKKPKKLQKMEIEIISDFQYLSSEDEKGDQRACARCKVPSGEKRIIYFDKITPELKEAENTGKKVIGLFYAAKKNDIVQFHCAGLAG